MRQGLLWGVVSLLAAVLFLIPLTPGHTEDSATFQILQPLAGQSIIGDSFPIVIAFQSTDDALIVRFDAYLDSTWITGGRIKNPIPAGSFRVDADKLNELKIKSGAHTLYVKLTDSQGRTTQQERSLSVKRAEARVIEHNPPKVRIVSPKDGDVITDTDHPKIQVEATDDTGIKYVIIYINKQIRAWMNEAPFMLSWNPADDRLHNGPVTLYAKAYDLFDNEGISSEVNVRYTTSRVPEGLTPLEHDTTIETHTDKTDLPTIFFPPTDQMLPNPGREITRNYANVVLPFTPMSLAAGLLPEIGILHPRALAQTLPVGTLLALLPPKTVPGMTRVEQLATPGAGSIAVPPALAALPGVTRPTASFNLAIFPQLTTPTAITILTPAAPSRDTREIDLPVLVAMLPAPDKGTPVHSASFALSATTTAAHATQDVELRGAGEITRVIPGMSVDTPQYSEQPAFTAPIMTLAPRSAMGDTPATGEGVLTLTSAKVAPLRPLANEGSELVVATHTQTIMQPSTTPAGLVGHPAQTTVNTPGSLTPETPNAATVVAQPRGIATDQPTVQTQPPATKVQPQTGVRSADPTAPLFIAKVVGVTPTTGNAAPTPTATGSLTHAASSMGAPQIAAFTSSRTVNTDQPTIPTSVTNVKAQPRSSSRPADAVEPLVMAKVIGVAPTMGSHVPQPSATSTDLSHDNSVPVVDVETFHVVKPHETFEKIARLANTTPEELVKMNPGISPERPVPGTHIAVPSSQARIYIDNTPVEGAPSPYIAKGYAMVPMRHIVEAKGGIVVWLPATREVNAWANNTYMHVKVGARQARIDNAEVTLPVAAALRKARTMVPLRYMLTALHMQVDYNPATGTYCLVSKARP